MDNELLKLIYYNREFQISHLPYDRETAFYKSIQLGNITEVRRLFKPLDAEGLGKLSDDKLRNLKYHLIITIAFITRYCIEGGLEMEEAYTLSDAYVNRVDKCSSDKQITDIHHGVVEEFTAKMNALMKKNLFSKPVMLGIDYIFDNLHSKISLDEVAAYAGCSPAYFSRLFHSEVGVTLKAYILEKKIDEAKGLLTFSDFSIAEIANTLYFSSESHFIRVFRNNVQVTPAQYRRLNYRRDSRSAKK